MTPRHTRVKFKILPEVNNETINVSKYIQKHGKIMLLKDMHQKLNRNQKN